MAGYIEEAAAWLKGSEGCSNYCSGLGGRFQKSWGAQVRGIFRVHARGDDHEHRGGPKAPNLLSMPDAVQPCNLANIIVSLHYKHFVFASTGRSLLSKLLTVLQLSF